MSELRITPGISKILKPGDVITIDGVFKRNPEWHWWSFWRPKHLPDLHRFKVVDGSAYSAMLTKVAA